ncbi:MAG: DMT family transporter [Desulfomonilia bacterium]
MFALISGASYGFLSILGKLGYRVGIEVMPLLSYRFFLASVIMGFYLLVKDYRLLVPSFRVLAKAATLGMLFYAIQSTLFFHALHHIPAATATLILYVYPITVTLLAMFIFKLKATGGIGASLLLLMCGCSLVFYDAFAKGQSILGIALATGAMVCLSAYLITIQFFLKGERPLSVTFYAIVFTSIFYSFFQNPLEVFTLNHDQVAVVLGLALIPTVIAVSLLYRAIELIGSAYTSIFSTLEPVVTVILAHQVLGERVVLIQVVGMILIILGIIVPNLHYLFGRQHTSLSKPEES